MFFKNYFTSVADRLEAKFQGCTIAGQHNSDKGELCEMFMKGFLDDAFSSNFKIYRGGQIININNNLSKQIDIVLCAKNIITIFKDKGIYPIETVYGVFSVTANLSYPKLTDCIDEFKSIPNQNLQLRYARDATTDEKERRLKVLPYKCVWGFDGDINLEWVHKLNENVSKDPDLKQVLPDIIIVNKKGMIQKKTKGHKFVSGKENPRDFHFTDFNKMGQYASCFYYLLVDLYVRMHYQLIAIPNYDVYFNADLAEIEKNK